MFQIFIRCKELWNNQTPSFRGYREAAQARRELELLWTASMKLRVKKGSDEKREAAIVQKRWTSSWRTWPRTT